MASTIITDRQDKAYDENNPLPTKLVDSALVIENVISFAL